MPTYKKKVLATDPRFAGRAAVISGAGMYSRIPIPDTVVLCDGCNANIHDMELREGYLIYMSKRELTKDQPYDFYCPSCTRRYFPKAVEVIQE